MLLWHDTGRSIPVVRLLCPAFGRDPAKSGRSSHIMQYSTYILQSEKSSRYYIGSCENLEKRLKVHNAGRVGVTKSGIPWMVVYREEYKTRRKPFVENSK